MSPCIFVIYVAQLKIQRQKIAVSLEQMDERVIIWKKEREKADEFGWADRSNASCDPSFDFVI